MEELKFVLTTPHGSQIEIWKEKDSETIFLQHIGILQRTTQTFSNIDELSEYLKKHVFQPTFRVLS